MAGLRALVREGASAPDPQHPVEAATITTTPTSPGDDVYVLLDGLPGQPVGPVLGWSNAPEANWPEKDGLCAVVRSSDGRHWFVGWESA